MILPAMGGMNKGQFLSHIERSQLLLVQYVWSE